MTPTAIRASGSYLGQLIQHIGSFVNMAFPLAGGLALLFFLWGVAQMIFHAGDENAVKEGKNRVKWGIVALFVMVSVWGLVGLMRQFLGIDLYTPDPGFKNPIPQRVCTTDSHGITVCTSI